MTRAGQPSKRDRIRAAAERILAERGEPMHIGHLAPLAWEAAGLELPLSPQDQRTVNNSLHDDNQRRFGRVSVGTWTLKRLMRR